MPVAVWAFCRWIAFRVVNFPRFRRLSGFRRIRVGESDLARQAGGLAGDHRGVVHHVLSGVVFVCDRFGLDVGVQCDWIH